MRTLLAVMMVMGSMACGGDSSTSPSSASVSGSYALNTVNGAALPFVIQSGPTSVTITADALVVADNGSWSEVGSYTQTFNGKTSSGTQNDGGSWVRVGTAVTLTSTTQGGGSYNGTFTGSGLSLTDDSGLHLVFSK